MTTDIMKVQTTDRWRRSGVIVVLVLLLGIGGCTAWLVDRDANDDQVAVDTVLEDVRAALAGAGYGDIEVSFDEDGHIVLEGIVLSEADSAEAERIAAGVPGVTEVVNLLQVVGPEPEPEPEPDPEPEPEPEPVEVERGSVEVAFGADGTITLVGVVADDATVAAVEAQVAAAYPDATIVNELTVAEVAAAALITITGEARTSADADANRLSIADLGVLFVDGAEVDDQQTVRNTDEEISFETELNDLMAAEPVQFASGSAELSPASTTTLDKVVSLFVANPGVPVLVGGHTDNSGGRDGNIALSAARAEAVRDYLVDKGVDAERLTTDGFGPDDPKVSNDTAAGRATNRRIEFTVNP